MQIVRYASDMGLKPGEWPRQLTHEDRRWNFHKTVRQTKGQDIGELAAVVYLPESDPSHPGNHDELHVLND